MYKKRVIPNEYRIISGLSRFWLRDRLCIIEVFIDTVSAPIKTTSRIY